MYRRDWIVATALLLALPAAAPRAQPDPIYPVPRYTGTPPFRLAVGSIDIVDRDPPTMRPPRVDHLFPVPPERAMRAWARDRLAPAGGPYRLVVTILKARATDTILRMEDGTLSRATTDQLSDRYDLEGEMRLDIFDSAGHAVATARAVATRYQTTLQSTSPTQRDGIWYDMTRQLVATLTAELDRQIQMHFTRFLR